MMHGWQSESTGGRKGGWSCAFWSACNGCSGHFTQQWSPHPQLLDVVCCSAAVVVVVA